MRNLMLENFNPDWAELRQQKETLLELSRMTQLEQSDYDSIDGLVKLLDYIQGQAIESGIWTNEDVFGSL